MHMHAHTHTSHSLVRTLSTKLSFAVYLALHLQCSKSVVCPLPLRRRLLESGIESVYWDIKDKKYHGRVRV